MLHLPWPHKHGSWFSRACSSAEMPTALKHPTFLNIAGMEKTSFRSVQSLLNRRFHGNMCGEFIVRSSIHPMKFPSEKKKQHMSIMSIQSFQNLTRNSQSEKPPKKTKKKTKNVQFAKAAKSWGPRAPCSPSASFLRWPFGPPASSPRSWFWGFPVDYDGL